MDSMALRSSYYSGDRCDGDYSKSLRWWTTGGGVTTVNDGDLCHGSELCEGEGGEGLEPVPGLPQLGAGPQEVPRHAPRWGRGSGTVHAMDVATPTSIIQGVH